MPHLRCIRRDCDERGHRLASPLPDGLPILFPSRRSRERAVNDRCKNPAYDVYRARGRL
jgi:hypothetical protein